MTVFKVRRRKGVCGKVVASQYYYGEYTADSGQRIRVCLFTTDKQVALAKLHGIVLEKQKEGLGMATPKSIREAAAKPLTEHLKEYAADLEATGCAAKYVYNVRKRIEKMISECGWASIAQVTADSFQNWRAKQQGTKAPKTLNEYLDALSAFLNWLMENERIAANPVRTVKKVQTLGKQVRIRRAFTDDEMRRLLAVAGARKAVYLAACYTGLRRAELESLEWADLHLDAPQPFALVRASTTKNGKEARIALHADLAEALLTLQKERKKGGSPFVFADLLPPMSIFRADLQKADISFLDPLGRRADFHALRHTLGTNLGRAGVAPRVAMAAMRHSDIKLTMSTYTDPSRLATADAFTLLPSFKTASDTQNNTDVLDAACHKFPCQPATNQKEGAMQLVDSEKVSPGLTPVDTVCQKKENGSKGRTRTYLNSRIFNDKAWYFMEQSSHDTQNNTDQNWTAAPWFLAWEKLAKGESTMPDRKLGPSGPRVSAA